MFWYHEATKHSYLSVRQDPHTLDWERKPPVFKHYPEHCIRYPLDLEHSEHRFLYEIAGLTLKKSYPGAEYYLRVQPSAGALYPNEIYFQAREVEGIVNGIYHYEADTQSIALMAPLDGPQGLEPYAGYQEMRRGYLFFLLAVYPRSAWKYRSRAFRYCLLDGGHLLGSIEAAALLKPHAVQVRYRIDREGLNRLFGFGGKEFFLSAASVTVPLRDREAVPFDSPLPSSGQENSGIVYPEIERAYRETMIIQECRRGIRPPAFDYAPGRLREAILARRSQRGFEGEAITKGQFRYLMECMAQPILSDCDEAIVIYAVVNRVIDLPPGLYREGNCLREGDFSHQTGYLCLEQYSLASHSAVPIFFTSAASNYQALYQKAGLLGHRLYIAANYLGIGCSGIGAYYDDEVNAFLGDDAMVLYALAVGR
jgi:SagB-type dehydrogenase family enzyme